MFGRSSIKIPHFCLRHHRRSWHGPPPFSNFLFTNLFSIKFLYFFIISSLFPYFNLFLSIFIQSYVNIKLHVSTLYRYLLSIYSTGTCFIQKIYAPFSSLLQSKHLPFSLSPLRLNIFRLFVILSLTQLYRYTPEIFLFTTATFKYTYQAPLRRIGQEYQRT